MMLQDSHRTVCQSSDQSGPQTQTCVPDLCFLILAQDECGVANDVDG